MKLIRRKYISISEVISLSYKSNFGNFIYFLLVNGFFGAGVGGYMLCRWVVHSLERKQSDQKIEKKIAQFL
jgi:hypothetical protein